MHRNYFWVQRLVTMTRCQGRTPAGQIETGHFPSTQHNAVVNSVSHFAASAGGTFVKGEGQTIDLTGLLSMTRYNFDPEHQCA